LHNVNERGLNTPSDLIKHRDWLAVCDCSDANTEVHHQEPDSDLANVLEKACRVVVDNPKHACAIRGIEDRRQ
jgi:hypothetical protein